MAVSSPPYQQNSPRFLTLLILVLFGISLAVKLGGNIWIKKQLKDSKISGYSYLGQDYPESWPIERKDVLMAFDNPNHFRLDTTDGTAEWTHALIPGDGLIYLGPHHQPFTISMFHQLRCLDVIRNETVTRNSALTDGTRPSILAQHCLNYLRQMVMCRGDLELESFQFASHKNPIDMHGVYECKDWEAVYTEVRKNQQENDVRLK